MIATLVIRMSLLFDEPVYKPALPGPLTSFAHDVQTTLWPRGMPQTARDWQWPDMPTAFESALLNLKLYDLRREPVLREARAWFLRDFNPDSLAELGTIMSGERNASVRMVLGYWDMAASLVTSGAIDAAAFLAAHGEIFATFGKIQPFLDEIRHASGESDFCAHMEKVVMADPNASAIILRRREAIRAAAKARSTS